MGYRHQTPSRRSRVLAEPSTQAHTLALASHTVRGYRACFSELGHDPADPRSPASLMPLPVVFKSEGAASWRRVEGRQWGRVWRLLPTHRVCSSDEEKVEEANPVPRSNKGDRRFEMRIILRRRRHSPGAHPEISASTC